MNDGAVKRKTSEANDHMVEAVGDVFTGSEPGATIGSTAFSGDLNSLLEEIPSKSPTKVSDEGYGPFCTVEADAVTGADGAGFVRGDVRRLSHFVTGMDKFTEKERPQVLAEVTRLVQTGAIRTSSPSEEGTQRVELPERATNADLQQEREKRIKAEREVERLREKLGETSPDDAWGEATGENADED